MAQPRPALVRPHRRQDTRHPRPPPGAVASEPPRPDTPAIPRDALEASGAADPPPTHHLRLGSTAIVQVPAPAPRAWTDPSIPRRCSTHYGHCVTIRYRCPARRGRHSWPGMPNRCRFSTLPVSHIGQRRSSSSRIGTIKSPDNSHPPSLASEIWTLGAGNVDIASPGGHGCVQTPRRRTRATRSAESSTTRSAAAPGASPACGRPRVRAGRIEVWWTAARRAASRPGPP